MNNIFFQVSILLGIIVSIAAVVRFMRQPLLVAYIIAGIIAGPLFLNLLNGDEQMFQAFAEFGVVLLLFVVGLSLNVEHIKRIGKTSVIIGLIQVLSTCIFGTVLLYFFHVSFVSALYLSLAITFSSTVIIVKLLGEKKDTATVYGRHILGLMVIQDIVAILVMVILDQFGTGKEILPLINIFVIKIILILAMVFFSARYILPFILDKVAKSSEFLFIFTIAWCFGMASFLYWLGFSLEVGAIIAGLTLGSSPYETEIASRIRPLRDFFIIIFFVILGSEMGFAKMEEILIPAIAIIIFVLVIKPFILYRLFRFMKFTRRNAFLSGITTAQVSEFGFILLFTGQRLGHIDGFELQTFTLVALTTIIISSYLITYNEQIYKMCIPILNIFGKDRHVQKEERVEKYDALVFGYHRMGWKVCEALEKTKMKYAVVDFDPNVLSKLKRKGIDSFFGDAADVEFLSSIPFDKTKLIILTIPAVDDQVTLIEHVRNISKKVHIIANVYEIEGLQELYKAGADYVMMPHFLGGNWIAQIILDEPLTKATMKTLKNLQSEEMKLRFQSEIN